MKPRAVIASESQLKLFVSKFMATTGVYPEGEVFRGFKLPLHLKTFESCACTKVLSLFGLSPLNPKFATGERYTLYTL